MKEISAIPEEGNSLIVFWAPWCSVCEQVKLFLKQFNTNINLIACNIDNNPILVGKYSILGLPTTIFFENGKEKNRLIGLFSKEELVELIKV